MPGLQKDQIKIHEKHGVITISGEKKLYKNDKKDGYVFVGTSHGSFNNSFNLPKDSDRENIYVEYADGMLTITIPKKSNVETESRPINIK